MSSDNIRLAEIRKYLFGEEGKDGLTRGEIRYVKFLLAKCQVDPISESPVEIVVMIALQLSPANFGKCLLVSKAWRQKLLSYPVISAYERHQWPAMMEGPTDRSNFLRTLNKFQRALYHSFLLSWPNIFETVRWDSRSKYQLDPVFHAQANTIPTAYQELCGNPDCLQVLYAFGKLAWCPGGCVVVIDDFESRTRKVFLPPSGYARGAAVRLQALGCKLIVASNNRVLIAWNHIDNRAYEKQLPGQVFKCATRDDKVAAVLYGGDVVIWTPGLAAVYLDTSKLVQNPGINPAKSVAPEKFQDVFFDRRDSTILYVVCAHSVCRDGKTMIHVGVHQFSKGVYVTSWSCERDDPMGRFYATGYVLKMQEYEFDHSAIIISLDCRVSPDYIDIVVFDKIEREFVDLDESSRWCWRSNDWIARRQKNMGDLDFVILYGPGCYEVGRLSGPPRHISQRRVKGTKSSAAHH